MKPFRGWTTHPHFRTWLFVFLSILGILGFEEVADDVFYDPKEGDFEAQLFDKSLANFFRSFQSPLLTQAMTDLTALGSISVLLTLFFVLFSVLWSYRDYKGLSYLLVVLIGAGAWPALLKIFFQRDRPDVANHLVHVSDLSFPSGHSFGAAAIYVALAFYSAQYAKNWIHEIFFYALGAILIALVGISRIYLGVHYPTDVLAGLCGGMAWAFLVSACFQFFLAFKRREFTRKWGNELAADF